MDLQHHNEAQVALAKENALSLDNRIAYANLVHKEYPSPEELHRFYIEQHAAEFHQHHPRDENNTTDT